jgi:hypothetical protein
MLVCHKSSIQVALYLDTPLCDCRAAVELLVDTADMRNIVPEPGTEVVIVAKQQDACVHACTTTHKQVVIMLSNTEQELLPHVGRSIDCSCRMYVHPHIPGQLLDAP